jgi:NAD(P)-dependent dehydrogenase (short-subunit alcohol dehydrogenase family)
MTTTLQGKIALVTGSSVGIGAAVARSLAADGAHVVVNARSSVEDGKALADELGGSFLQADVADPAESRRLVADVLAAHGRLDILVNNAGTTQSIPYADLATATPELWMKLYATNVVAPFVLITEAIEALKAAGGVVVSMGSIAGLRPTGSSIPYAASKAALHHMTLMLAATFGPDVRFNVVAPGLVDTRWTEGWTDQRAAYSVMAPMKRIATPEDVAEAVRFLVVNDYLSGEVVSVDGGMWLR